MINFLRVLKAKYIFLINKTRTLGPFGPLLFFLVFCLLLFLGFRLIFSALYWDRIIQEPRFYLMYLIGVRMDLIIICYLLFLPSIFFLLLPFRFNKYLAYLWSLYFTLIIAVAFFFEMSTIPFLKEYDLRPDAIFLKYLKHYKEVGATVWATNKWYLIITILLVTLLTRFVWKLFRMIIVNYQPLHWKYRALALPIIGAILFLGARSSVAPRPANISTAYFSEQNKLVNELTLNSTYTLFIAATRLLNEQDPSAFYGSMTEVEMYQRVKRNIAMPDSLYVQSDIPFSHKHIPKEKIKPPMNVVIILEESLGAEYVGYLNGLPLTPNLDKLSRQGLAFTNLYATGTRTVRGIEAVVTGFLPTPGSSIVNLGLSRSGFFTAGQLFKKAGYTTEFIYGGESNFDEMRSFFIGNGFEKIYDQPTFKNPVFEGVWGVSDEDLMVKADEIFKAHGDKPFFSVILSTSNHSPYEFPDGRIQLHEQPKNTVYNAMKYADYAIGKFFNIAKKSAYYKNTIFLVVADHSTRVFGDEFIPVHKFHIPGVIIGPNIPVQQYAKVASQIDLLPTLLYFAGLSLTSPMIGRNVMNVPESDPGRCFMQYGMNYGYMIGDSLTILKPYVKPQEFIYDGSTFKLSFVKKVNVERARDALAFSLLPWSLYQSKLYRLE